MHPPILDRMRKIVNKCEASQSVPAEKKIRYIRRESELKLFILRSVIPPTIKTQFEKK